MTQQEKEIKMFGVTTAHMDEAIKINAPVTGEKMMIMSMLSDLQEEVACDYMTKEELRQKINRIKYFVQKNNS